jgi:hypothetical protein
LEQRILTWDNLIKRGFLGPSICVLCKKSEETVLHLFGECSFINGIWQTITKELKLVNSWQGGQIEVSLQNWLRVKENWKEIPCFICWEVWKHRNLLFFKTIPKIKLEFATVFCRTWGNKKLHRSLNIEGLIGHPFLTGTW